MSGIPTTQSGRIDRNKKNRSMSTQMRKAELQVRPALFEKEQPFAIRQPPVVDRVQIKHSGKQSPRSNRARKSRGCSAADPVPVVAPPKRKRASNSRSSHEADPASAVVPPKKKEENKPSTTSKQDAVTSSKLGKKATKPKLKRKSLKGSAKRSLKPKDEEPTKRRAPQPPAAPKRR